MKKIVRKKVLNRFRPLAKSGLQTVPLRELPAEQPIPRGRTTQKQAPIAAASADVAIVDDRVLAAWLSDSRVLAAVPALAGPARDLAAMPTNCGRCAAKRAAYRKKVARDARKILVGLSPDGQAALKNVLGVKKYTLMTKTKGGVVPQEF